VSSRGPRLLIPSGLLGVGLTTLIALAYNIHRFPGDARALVLGTIAVVVADGVQAWRALHQLDAEILTPAVVVTGTSFEARARISGVRRPATVDPLFPDAEPTRFDGDQPFALTCHPAQRGVFNHLLVEVRCRSPLGLWACARRVAVLLPGPLWVAPVPRADTPPAPTGPPRPAGRQQPSGQRDQRDPVVRATRPYEPGDSRRLVHWPATAHEGRLMVRETESESDPASVLVVDLSGPTLAAEWALGQAVTAATAALAGDGRVRLVTAEPIDTNTDIPIPRSVLLPGAALRVGPPAPGPTHTVDRVETTEVGIQRRLAAAATAPVDRRGLPPGCRYLADDGGDRS
jgi:uncharacterized protein (DUF58 family)